jgi:hypothetical protein
MRLVEIPTAATNVSPVYVRSRLNLVQDLLESADPAKKFWAQTSFPPEQVDKMLVAKANFGRD